MNICLYPNFLIKKLSNNFDKQINLNILFSNLSILIFLIFISKINNFLSYIPHFCLFQTLFDIPCPGCGIIRSIICILNFDFLKSISYNPLGILIIITILFQINFRLISLINNKFNYFTFKLFYILEKVIIINMILCWIYKIYKLYI